MTSIELRQSICSHSPNARRARQNLNAIRGEIARIGAAMQFELTTTQGTHPDEPAIVSVGTSDTLDVLARYHLAEKLITESAIAAEIPELDALFAQIAEAEVREAAAATLAQAAQNALEEARAAALAKAEAKIDSDPAVKKAREAMEALQAAPAPVIAEPVVELPSDLLDLESDHEELVGDFK
jgi:hypothetical protein